MGKNYTQNFRECYIINGGGQKVEQLAGMGLTIPYRREMNDWAYKSGVSGANHYTNYIWADSLERLRELAEEWTDAPVELAEE